MLTLDTFCKYALDSSLIKRLLPSKNNPLSEIHPSQRDIINIVETMRSYCGRVARVKSIIEGTEAYERDAMERLLQSDSAWISILLKYNPYYPSETLDVYTALNWVRAGTPTTVECVDFVWECVPERNKTELKLTTGGFIIHTIPGKYDSTAWNISCPNGILFPFIIQVKRSSDDHSPQDKFIKTLILTEGEVDKHSAEGIKKQIRDFLQSTIRG